MRQRGLAECVLELFYPRRCPVCDSALPIMYEAAVCEKCKDVPMPVMEPVCQLCGKPLEQGEDEYCLDCNQGGHCFTQGKAVFVYDRRMRETMGRFKYHGRREYAAFFADAICDRYGGWMTDLMPDALVPVPIHPRRRTQRGYNQAELIAVNVGRRLQIPVIGDLLLRQKDTEPQRQLSPQERSQNLKKAFSVNEQQWQLCRGMKCVIMVDDIYTTGSTVDACAQTLREIGIGKVFYICTCIGKGY